MEDTLPFSLPWILVIVLLGIVLYQWLSFKYRVKAVEARIERRYRDLLEDWKETELENYAARINSLLEEKYMAMLEKWKAEAEDRIRRDALDRSASVVLGRVGEQLAPLFFPGKLGASPKDARFIGSPVDYIVFKGLYEGRPEEIVFVEVKTSRKAGLSDRERKVKRLVDECRIRWVTMDLGGMILNVDGSSLPRSLPLAGEDAVE